MSDNELRYPLLDTFYQQYLNDEHTAAFVRSVLCTYTTATLERLGECGHVMTRRAAILALGFVGEYSSNEMMGNALHDTDRTVRFLADNGLRQIWPRQGSQADQHLVKRLYRLNSKDQLEEAIDLATDLVSRNPDLCEAWNQRAISFCAMGDFHAAIEDCKETLNCNRFHFPAAMGMAHCCLQLDDAHSALDCFRLALAINPDLDGVRNHIRQLERALDI